MIRRILDVVKHGIVTQKKPILGRWNMHNERETILKIKYANEDNCGISGNNHKNTRQIQNNYDIDDKQYIYSMGYESVHN